MSKFLLTALFALILLTGKGQELLCNVEVNSQQVQGSDRRVYETMRNAIYDFMNNRAWTNFDYKQNERIECSILINVTDRPASNLFKCDMTIAVRRPVFNSSYNTVLFNFIDRDVEINYIENQPMTFNTGMFDENLTSILAFYAYFLIGLDFDSFVMEGGDPYYEEALNIVNLAQNTDYKGWKSMESNKNRYWLLENITNPSYNGLRKFYYEYHLKGLDIMYDNADGGKKAMLQTLKYLQEVKKARPGLVMLQVISDSKRDEFVNVFSEATSAEKTEAVNLLKEIDPSNTMTYQKILQK
jgi:hypothetical protein